MSAEPMSADEVIADLQHVHDIYGIDLSKTIRGVAALIAREAELEAGMRRILDDRGLRTDGTAEELLERLHYRSNDDRDLHVAALNNLSELQAKRDALEAENRKMRDALRPLADMAPHFPTTRTYGNRPSAGVIYEVESPQCGVASINVEHLHDAAALLARAEAGHG